MISQEATEELLGANTVKCMYPKLEWYDCLTVWRRADKHLNGGSQTYDVYDAIVRTYVELDFDSPINTGEQLKGQ